MLDPLYRNRLTYQKTHQGFDWADHQAQQTKTKQAIITISYNIYRVTNKIQPNIYILSIYLRFLSSQKEKKKSENERERESSREIAITQRWEVIHVSKRDREIGSTTIETLPINGDDGNFRSPMYQFHQHYLSVVTTISPQTIVDNISLRRMSSTTFCSKQKKLNIKLITTC